VEVEKIVYQDRIVYKERPTTPREVTSQLPSPPEYCYDIRTIMVPVKHIEIETVLVQVQVHLSHLPL